MVTVTNPETGESGDYSQQQYDDLSSHEQDLLQMAYAMNQGRVLGNVRGPPMFKRWRGMWGEGRGAEFRPLGVADYGYTDEMETWVSWGVWALQTIAAYSLGGRKATALLASGMVLNDFVSPLVFSRPGIGASFVHNYEFGYLLYHLIRKKNRSTLVKVACGVEIAMDLYCVFDELRKGLQLGTLYGHSRHVTGIVLGFMTAAGFTKF